jgi:branched-chain amino acid transport system ATP-binding protein
LIVKEIFATIDELRADGLTILLVEQNAHLALAASSYAYVIENGSIVLEGSADHLRSDPAIVRTYLGQSERAVND